MFFIDIREKNNFTFNVYLWAPAVGTLADNIFRIAFKTTRGIVVFKKLGKYFQWTKKA